MLNAQILKMHHRWCYFKIKMRSFVAGRIEKWNMGDKWNTMSCIVSVRNVFFFCCVRFSSFVCRSRPSFIKSFTCVKSALNATNKRAAYFPLCFVYFIIRRCFVCAERLWVQLVIVIDNETRPLNKHSRAARSFKRDTQANTHAISLALLLAFGALSTIPLQNL